MSILKYKYKAHKLINYAFYVVVFVVGFIMGFGAEKINFNKLISQVLMIDDVSAYNIATNNGITFNEEFIYNQFNDNFEDFDFIKYHNVWCNYSSTYSLQCYAMTDETYNNINFTVSGSTINYDSTTNGVHIDLYRFQYYLGSWSSRDPVYYYYNRYTDGNFLYRGSCTTECYFNGYPSNLEENTTFTNRVLLDFSEYQIPDMVYNENLFKDNPDFKEVCVEEGKSFAITSTQMSDINSVYDYDYFWLPYNLNGISKILYDNSVETNEIHYTEEEAKERYFYNTKENIDSFYSNDIPGLELEIKGYTDKYSYYGWSAWPFRVYYSESYNQYNIFTIEEPTKIYVGNLNEDGNVHGGGGLRLDGDEEIEISSNYCFYIKNIYEVTYVNIDEWGDYHGTVPTPNGDYEFSTSHNKLNSNTDSFLNQPIKFINSMKDTINLINSLIYEFYISLPTLIRTFIITVLIILLIMLIMSIGGYK